MGADKNLVGYAQLICAVARTPNEEDRKESRGTLFFRLSAFSPEPGSRTYF